MTEAGVLVVIAAGRAVRGALVAAQAAPAVAAQVVLDTVAQAAPAHTATSSATIGRVAMATVAKAGEKCHAVAQVGC